MSRYAVPDPKCRHARRGIVTAGGPEGAHAATNVCDRPECIADAIEWARAVTTLEPQHRPDPPRSRPAQRDCRDAVLAACHPGCGWNGEVTLDDGRWTCPRCGQGHEWQDHRGAQRDGYGADEPDAQALADCEDALRLRDES